MLENILENTPELPCEKCNKIIGRVQSLLILQSSSDGSFICFKCREAETGKNQMEAMIEVINSVRVDDEGIKFNK